MTWKEHLRKGSLALAREDYPFAQTELSLALVEAKTSFNDENRLGIIYGLLAQSFFKQANFEKAEPLLKQAIALESHAATKTGMQAKTRDLICLSEILRKQGNSSEAHACLEDAIASFSEPVVVDDLSGSEEFAALKNLFASAQTRRASAHSKPQQKTVNKKVLEETTTGIEQEYQQLVHLVNKLERSRNRNQAKLLSALLVLVQLGMKLGLTEQAERFLRCAFTVAFGRNHGRQLSIPHGSSVTDAFSVPSLVVSLMVTKADFYTHCYDFASASKCFAELMKWMEKNEHSVDLVDDSESSKFVSSFICLTQKADLYVSARLLIKQAIELDEYSEHQKAVSVYDKTLAIFEQLFPHSHLEIAQLLQFKAAALAAAGLQSEADELQCQAALIEDEISARAQKAEVIAQRLPILDLRWSR